MRGADRIKPSPTPKTDREHSEPLSASKPDKINVSQTKTALHRTRLRVLDHKNFSVLFFYKPHSQPAPLLAVCRKTKTEKNERNFTFFQLVGSGNKLILCITHCFYFDNFIFRQLNGYYYEFKGKLNNQRRTRHMAGFS
ncbi:hypothetical protein OA46_19535 [Enterobacter cloacae]|nr:hypothetical protein OA46_19535 [Enterobacter cloacae]